MSNTTTATCLPLLPSLPQADLATQSGPMLVIDGRLHPRFDRYSNSLKTRSGGRTGGWQSHIRHLAGGSVVLCFRTPIP
jgi:hypothetical protein